MKSNSKKAEYIILRAEGLSYAKIAEKIGISKSTCSKWETELAGEIQAAKDERLEELQTLYRIGRAAHIEKLGKMLERITEALEQKDLAEVPADKLLKIYLDYEGKLQALKTEPGAAFKDYTGEELLAAIGSLYEKMKAGEITPQQAKAELTALDTMRRTQAEQFNAW